MDEKEQKKICLKCNVEKSMDEYPFRKDSNKYRNQCKVCTVERLKNFYLDNKEKIARKKGEWSQNKKKEKVAIKKAELFRIMKKKFLLIMQNTFRIIEKKSGRKNTNEIDVKKI